MTLVEKYPFASCLGAFSSLTMDDVRPFLLVIFGFAIDKGFNYVQKRFKK